MKKNKRTYILLVAVLIIWGFLGYRILGAINPSEKPAVKQDLVGRPYQIALKKRDTFSVHADYRDPFLGTWPDGKKKTLRKKALAAKKETPQRNIVYSGSLAENGSDQRLFFVTIEGNQQIMAKNEVVQGVKLVNGTSESIKVQYGGRMETIALQK
ncbi:MAG: hypothetical protein AAF634_06480 [Bacteroidota bacterium]